MTDGVLFCEDKSAICVTCSDDCSVIVSHFSYTNRELHLLERRSLHGHRSSVKCITSVQNQGFSGSIVFTAGGRAQICAWFVGLSGNYYMILYTALCWRHAMAQCIEHLFYVLGLLRSSCGIFLPFIHVRFSL